MTMWNELDYETQKRVMDLVEDLLLKQTDITMQDGLAAALTELEIWSNSPIRIVKDENGEPYVAQAADPDWDD